MRLVNTPMKKAVVLVSTVLFALLLSGCTSGGTTNTTNTTGAGNTTSQAVAIANDNTNAEASDRDKMCSWVDSSDVIMKLNFAEGVEKDGSYEAGFYVSEINLFARLARK